MLVAMLDGTCPACAREVVFEKWRGYVRQEIDGQVYEIEDEHCRCPQCGHKFDPDSLDDEYGSAWKRFRRTHGKL